MAPCTATSSRCGRSICARRPGWTGWCMTARSMWCAMRWACTPSALACRAGASRRSMKSELAHLREREHNKAFYRLCEHLEPAYHQLELDVRLYLTHLEAGGARLWGLPDSAPA